MRIVIAPDSFKEALSAPAVCEAIARGVQKVLPEAELELVPMADGGEGTVDALVAATGGRPVVSCVCDPSGRPVEARWGLFGERDSTAVIEMAAASGLPLVPPELRDPTRTSTFGTGQLIRAALNAGVHRILIGIGGSATNDGGVGAAQALGVRFLDRTGRLARTVLCGGDLTVIESIDLSGRDPRLGRTRITVACDVDNPLCGPRGASAVFGPQKGATPAQVELLDAGLRHLAKLIQRDCGLDVADMPGAGAAGGLGAGLVAFCGATLCSGVQMVMEALKLRERLAGADLVITGEGRLDAQSLMGKVVAGVGQAARHAGVPVIAFVGAADEGNDQILTLLNRYDIITPPDTPLPEALGRTALNLEETARRVLSRWPAI